MNKKIIITVIVIAILGAAIYLIVDKSYYQNKLNKAEMRAPVTTEQNVDDNLDVMSTDGGKAGITATSPVKPVTNNKQQLNQAPKGGAPVKY